jgi:DNA-binding response OmpR family regulator
MEPKAILVVDDEKNIRMTMAQALDQTGIYVETALNGEEALQKLGRGGFSLVFLDLKLPGMDGMEVLRRIRETWPAVRVVIITAHGTIGGAVEAMKLGAMDFIQKPFSPAEIRNLASLVLARETLDEESAVDYTALIELAKRRIADRQTALAGETLGKAVAFDPSRPEAYNLLGALFEIGNDRLEALKFYRAALDIDPTFGPASANLERATSWNRYGRIDLGEDKAPKTRGHGNGDRGHDEE